jgi:hypothetical protein
MRNAISFITLIVFTLLTVTSASISLELPSSECTVRNIHGYTEFSGSDYACVTGAPKLPASVVRFLVPPEADMSSVRISFSNLKEKEIEGDYLVRPVAPAMSTMGTVAKITDREIVDGKDIAIYSSNAFYPADYAEVVSTGKLWNFKILEVVVYHYRYNPVTKKLVKAVNGKLEVGYDKLRTKPVFKYQTPRRIRKRAANLTVNYADIAPGYGIAASDNPAIKETYMIITTQAIKDGLANFGTFVNTRGADYDVQVILEDTWGGGTGDAGAENLREYLKTIYEMMSLSYILLIGDGTPEDGGETGYDPGDLAMKVTVPWLNTGWHDDKVPTDFYYAELSGNWDPDGDGKYGEAPADGNDQDFVDGGVDGYAEICVGRIPVYENNLEPVDVILNKTVDYISETDIAWRKNALLIPAKLAEPDALSYDVCEVLKTEGCDPVGVSTFRMYEQDYGCSPEKVGLGYSVCKSQFTSEPYGICNYIGHGNFNKCVDIFQNTDVINFGNDNPAIIFAVTCLNNQIEKKYSIGYTFLQHGGIAVLGGTRVTWYCPNTHDYATSVWPTNQVFGYRPAKLMIFDSLTTGECFDETKAHCSWINNPSYMGNLFGYTCFGDPALKLWGEEVTDIDKHPNSAGNNMVRPRLYYLNNAVEFRYNHLSNGTITLNIFDLKGKQVYSAEKRVTSGVQSVTWDYGKSNGKPVARGIYMARIHYSNGNNSTGTFSTKVLLQK